MAQVQILGVVFTAICVAAPGKWNNQVFTESGAFGKVNSAERESVVKTGRVARSTVPVNRLAGPVRPAQLAYR